MNLNNKDILLMQRLIKRRKYFLAFSILGTLMGIVVLLYHIAKGDLDGTRFVLVVFILLAGRANLRQYRVSLLLEKLGGAAPRVDGDSAPRVNPPADGAGPAGGNIHDLR